MVKRQFRWAFALLPLLLAGCGGAAAAAKAPGGWDIREYNTGDSSELVATIPVHVTSGDNYRVIYCLDLGDAPVGGEILQVSTHAQVTIPHYDTVAVTTQLYLADTCQSTGGTEIGEAQGTNLDRPTHHLSINRTGSVTVEEYNERHYVVLLAWSASSTAKPGDHLVVDNDYGRLSVIRFTPLA